jgi:hypothetical protein
MIIGEAPIAGKTLNEARTGAPSLAQTAYLGCQPSKSGLQIQAP